jgi:hypothetical protein
MIFPVESPNSVLTPKRAVKHEHTHMQLTTQQLALVIVRTGLTDRDNRFDWYSEDQRVDVRIMITTTLSW